MAKAKRRRKPAAPRKSRVRLAKEERVAWLTKRLEDLDVDLMDAREAQGWTAVSSLHKEVRTYQAERHALTMELAHEDDLAAAETADELTPEQWLDKNREDARAASDDALELYLHEWLTRSRLTLVFEGGEPVLRRQAS